MGNNNICPNSKQHAPQHRDQQGGIKNESTRNPSICMHAMMNMRDEDRVEEQTERNKKLEPRNAIS
jgi:hypothetical protein